MCGTCDWRVHALRAMDLAVEREPWRKPEIPVQIARSIVARGHVTPEQMDFLSDLEEGKETS